MNKEKSAVSANLMKYIGATLMFTGLILMAVGLLGLCMEMFSFEVGGSLLTLSAVAGWIGAECIDYMEGKNE